MNHAIALVFTIALFSMSGAYCQEFTRLERLEASVNKELILKSDIDEFRRTMPLRAQLDSFFQNSSVAKAGAGVKDADIQKYLLEDRLIRSKFPVSQDELTSEIDQIRSSNQMSLEQMRTMLQAQGYTLKDYESLMRSSISVRNLISREITSKVVISDAEAKSFYLNKHPEGKQRPKAYLLSILSNSSERIVSSAVSKLKSGESFESVAKSLSQDSSKDRGGSLGYLSDSQLNPTLRQAIQKLKQGEVSPVIKASKSLFLIVKLVDIKSEADDSFEKKKEEIKNQLAQEEYRVQLALWLEKQGAEAYIYEATHEEKK